MTQLTNSNAMPGEPVGSPPAAGAGTLFDDIRTLIETTRSRAASAINAELVALHWQIGHRILGEILVYERADYGRQIVQNLAATLAQKYGRGFSRANLFHMIRFTEAFPDPEIVYALSRQLSWTHFRELIYVDDPLQRTFYAEMCRLERWSVRTLRTKVQGMLYERTAISRKPAELIKSELAALRAEDRLTPDLVFHDPYVLDFLGLADTFSERDLEAAILREIERFLLELGTDFAFLARQKRLTIDHDDYYIDLLFYHRRLQRLVAIDLKLGRFQAADKGQMELYLRWLERYDQAPGENSPLGLILCAEKSAEHIELLRLEQSGIRVAEYLTELPPREVLARKLHEAIQSARQRLENQNK